MRNFSDSFMNRLCSFSFPLCVSPLLPFYLYFLRSSLLMSCSSVGYHSTREEKKSTHTESPAYHSFSSSISPLILPLRLSSCSLHLSRHPHSLLLFSSARSCCCFLILFILLVKFGPVLTWVRWGLWILAFEYADMFSLTWQLSFTVRPHTQDAHGHTRRSRERISPPPPPLRLFGDVRNTHTAMTHHMSSVVFLNVIFPLSPEANPTKLSLVNVNPLAFASIHCENESSGSLPSHYSNKWREFK